MTLIVRTGLIAVWLIGLATTTLAQTPVELTLEDAVRRGLDHAPRLAEARSRQAAAAAAVRIREAMFRPSITAMSGLLRTNHVDEFGVPQAGGGTRVIFPDIPTNYRVRAELTLPIFTAGRRDALVTSAEADDRAVAAEQQALAADVELEIATAYWNLVAARSAVGVREQALTRADASLADVEARVDVGLLPDNDRLSAQAQRARQRVHLIEAEHQAALAEVQLARLVGLPLDEAIVTTTPVDRPTPGVEAMLAQPPGALADRARTDRSERAALVERRRSLEAAADATLAATRPQVAALAGIEPARPNARFVPRTDEWNTAWDLAINVTWSLWDGGRARAERAATVAQADAVAARLDEFDQLVAVEVRQRQLDVVRTSATIEAASEAVTAAADALRTIGERFEVGMATPTDVLGAELALLEAELDQMRLRAALRVDEARLLRAAGRP